MSKADEWLKVQVSNYGSKPRWVSNGAFHASAELHYRGPGYGPMVMMKFGAEETHLLAAVDARSLGKWLLGVVELCQLPSKT